MNPKNGLLRERRFERLMRTRGVQLERPSRVFRFQRTTYHPDFYAPETDTYYEVIGSRQRMYGLASTLDLMEIVYPEVILLVVRPSGEEVTLKAWSRARVVRADPVLAAFWDEVSRRGLSLTDAAQAVGVTPSCLSGLFRGKRNHVRNATLDGIKEWLDAREQVPA